MSRLPRVCSVLNAPEARRSSDYGAPEQGSDSGEVEQVGSGPRCVDVDVTGRVNPQRSRCFSVLEGKLAGS